jgi:hypothetical protein
MGIAPIVAHGARTTRMTSFGVLTQVQLHRRHHRHLLHQVPLALLTPHVQDLMETAAQQQMVCSWIAAQPILG